MSYTPPFIKSIQINKVRHLQDIFIQIDEERPRHLILTGPNGSGKTSLLRFIKDYLEGAGFWPLLNCTDAADQIWESIEIRFTPFPKATVEILLTASCSNPLAGKNTRQLLEKILAGKNTTPIQIDQAANLRKKMLRTHTDLMLAIQNKETDRIKNVVADHAPFAGMLRWCLKNKFPEQFEQAFS